MQRGNTDQFLRTSQTRGDLIIIKITVKRWIPLPPPSFNCEWNGLPRIVLLFKNQRNKRNKFSSSFLSDPYLNSGPPARRTREKRSERNKRRRKKRVKGGIFLIVFHCNGWLTKSVGTIGQKKSDFSFDYSFTSSISPSLKLKVIHFSPGRIIKQGVEICK